VSWKGERWADIVARAAKREPRRLKAALDREPPEALAARARRWEQPIEHVAVRGDTLELGVGIHAVSIELRDLYHLEPVDPWPSLAVGWVDRGIAYRAVAGPEEEDADAFDREVRAAVAAAEERAPRAVHRGWLAVPEVPWAPAEHLPGEVEEGPRGRGYRHAPGRPDPILAVREIRNPAARLFTWVMSRLGRGIRRIEPSKIVVTERFVTVRTADRRILRVPLETLRDDRRSEAGAVFVFGRRTELLVVDGTGCDVTRVLLGRLRRR
jgi:hypothetical protein